MKNYYALDYIIEQIKEHIDGREIAEEHLNLNKQGMAHCPFHSDHTPSFSVSSKKKMFKCFSCGIGGDVIRLYAVLNHVSNGQAISQLGKRLGLTGKSKLTKVQKIEVSKRFEDKQLEKQFQQEFKCLFYSLCDVRDYMMARTKIHQEIEQMERDALLVQFYQEKAYHEYLLDGLLAGMFEEIDFEQQIDYYEKAKEVIEKWEVLLEKQKPTFSESIA
jgi:hypothetical protein